ncbi:protoporphyrinogen/coproporphyrinogen oxidase [Hymenobacter chitinivorans]|uniref:Phytoene dehydrogenase-like protein n=1 Tax=Hymenobacter chitinivorans DSM 11115 TaxID=1121954 RepID=A0A2M9B4D5_9BACT|nr:NAD(P)/FAD-dependent oxidoreductase [Hymenobacter chitinivorans]PJJ52804.1 phytoene dehydrogenase-like protein [Hymenobacter chitinivorans DSM 11115]
MSQTSATPIIIIGAGMAGLTCANYLHRAGRSVLVLEAADAVGGRVRTDVTPEGFRLDRGFQVLQTRYPEVQRLLDYGALRLRAFRSGAAIRLADGRQTTLVNPLDQPLAAFSALTSPIGTLADKFRILALAKRVKTSTNQELLDFPSADTLTYLRQNGWSEQIIDSFFRPFFGGVFLDRSLSTASNFFEFVFKQFVEGEAAIPALGMQQIPEQLAARLPAGSVRLNTAVASVQSHAVELTSGETLDAAAVVVATDGEAAARLLPTSRLSFPTAWRRTTCTYFAAEASPVKADKLLRLNAAPNTLAHNVAFPSHVAPDYAPAGRTLVSVSTHGSQGLTEEELTTYLREDLAIWFGPEARRWQHLRTYHLPQALPVYPGGQPPHQPLQLSQNLYRCGDYAAYPSLNAAMATGREVAEALLAS